MRRKEKFGIFSNPMMGTRKDIPSLLLTETVTPDNDKVVLIDGEIHRRKMRDYFLLDTGDAVQTPDGYPVMEIVGYVKESTNTLYLLVFTKKHIYYWNSDDSTLDVKHTLTNDATSWDYCIFNDQIIAVPDSDYPVVWDATGDFEKLDTDYGVRVGYSSEITTVDDDSAADQKVLKVAATSDLTAGDTVIIDKDGDKEEIGQIDIIDAGVSITLLDNLTYEHTSGDADTVHICTCITKAKYVCEYRRYLILGYPYLDQDGQWYPQGIYISKIGDEDDFVSSSAVGYFGIGQQGKIKGFGFYQGFLYIFKEDGRVQFFPVAGSEYFNYNEIQDNFGLLATHSVVNDDKGNMYYLASDFTIKQEGKGTISQPIQTDIINEIQPDQIDKVRGAYVSDYGELMWVVYKDGIWLLIKDVNITAFGEYYA